MANFLTKIFGTHSSHELKKIYPIADKVDALEEQFKKLTDDELRAKTDEFKQRYQNGETLDQLLPEAFATCREAAWRVLGMRHYRVQIIGGIVLHQGRIAEMKTGEGKTLVATLPAYLNALTGKGTVADNDTLAYQIIVNLHGIRHTGQEEIGMGREHLHRTWQCGELGFQILPFFFQCLHPTFYFIIAVKHFHCLLLCQLVHVIGIFYLTEDADNIR